MSAAPSPELYEAVLVPALQRIQHDFGYLKREELEKFSAESGIPEYRLQAVASFFPHFQLAPPKKCTVKVCRDMACHLAGSAETLRDLQSVVSNDVGVEGVSCVGRCDRAAAAGITVQGLEHDLYYHGRTTAQLKEIIAACVEGVPPRADHDADLAYSSKDWVLDSYKGETPQYTVVSKAIALRDASLRKAQEILAAKFGWGPERLERFRQGCIRQMRIDFKMEPEVAEAVRCWQTEQDWGKGPELGGWSEALIAELGAGELRGLGGAGIPVTQKWRDVRDAVRTARAREVDDRAFIVVNGDESEPGTFKDREILLRAPHTVLEGVILAGLITEATQGFIYIRHEYGEQVDACRAEIARAEELGLCGVNATVLGRSFHVSVFVSPGGYICGEQSALIEAMSDRRGEPRNMPPKLETNGLIDLPTLVSNVETFAWAPYICLNGGKTYADLGVNTWKGRRFFSVSGDVKRPGVYEVPMGMTLRELVYGENYCQGIVGDRPLKGFAPSGPSGGFLPAKLTVEAGLPRKHVENKVWQALAARRGIEPTASELEILDLELELNLFRGLSPTQALGAGVVVYAEGRDMAAEALNSIEFYRVESCGKCVPCRLGSQKLASLTAHLVQGNISADRWKNELIPLIKEMGKAIELASICGLGRSVPVPLLTAISFFDDDIDRHLTGSNGNSAPA
jgi:NADH:ubiquinone oxidoreductase subunit F (NADH-binding)/NADH:ubiquinone oxidoreductase subunit E